MSTNSAQDDPLSPPRASVDTWWRRLSPSAQAWLAANNGDALADGIRDEIVAAGGVPLRGKTGEEDSKGWFLDDAEVDWIEAWANDEG